MLDVETQARILELKGTASARSIAKLLCVSRGSVDNTIRRGFVREHQRSYRGGDAFKDREVRRVAPYYCPGCDFRVYLEPCQICAAGKRANDDDRM